MHNIQFSIDAFGVGTAVLDMPGRPFNVFSDEMIDELVMLIDTIEEARPAGVVIASGKSAFMAGADLAMVRGFTTLRLREPPDVVRRAFTRLTYVMRRLERLPVPTVAAVNGLALGGGLELAMACHRRIAVPSEEPSLGLPEVLLGLLPGAGGTQRLPRLVGVELAARMLLGGRSISPLAAHAAGLIDELTTAEALLERARALALDIEPGARWDAAGWHAPAHGRALLDGPEATARLLTHAGIDRRSAHCYPAYAAICRCLIDGYDLPLDLAIEIEADRFLPLMLEPTASNMVRTGFLAKTAAAKRAAQRLGGDGKVAKIVGRGPGPVPERIKQRFELVDAPNSADAVLAFAADAVADDVIAVRDVLHSASAHARVELRTTGGLDAAEAIEIAAAPGALAARALAIANRLRLVPVAVAPTVPGPSERLLAAARAWLVEHPTAETARMANAADLHRLFAHLGLPPASAAEHTDHDRGAALDLLCCMAIEAAACMADGLVEGPPDLDLIAVFGVGFPAWTGGPLTFQDLQRRGEIAGCALPAGAGTTPWYAN